MRCVVIAIIVVMSAALAFGQSDIPTVDSLDTVTVAPVEAKTYDKRYPVMVVFRYIEQGDAYQPILQRLSMAPARVDAQGQVDVLMDSSKYLNLTDVNIREQRARSPVVKAAFDNLVEKVGLLAKELVLGKRLQAAEDAKAAIVANIEQQNQERLAAASEGEQVDLLEADTSTQDAEIAAVKAVIDPIRNALGIEQ